MVGLNYNVAKTEYMLIGNWNIERSQNFVIRVSSGAVINEVKDFKYLGSWLLNCTKDFEISKQLAWNTATKL